MKIFINSFSLLVLMLTGCASYAQDPTATTATQPPVQASIPASSSTPPPVPVTPDEVKARLAKNFPTLPASAVASETSIPGLYQIIANGQYVFTDAEADYLITGNVIHSDTKISLVDEDLAKKRGPIWSELPTKLAFTKVYGKGERKIAIFFDPDCPYCKQQELDMNQADPAKLNLTVYYYLNPLPIHPDAARKADAIYCASNKTETLDNWINNQKNPEIKEGKVCNSKVNDIIKFAQSKYIFGTPGLVFPDNYVLSSYLTIDKLLDVVAAHNK